MTRDELYIHPLVTERAGNEAQRLRTVFGLTATESKEIYRSIVDASVYFAMALMQNEAKVQAEEHGEIERLLCQIGNDWLQAGDYHKSAATEYLISAIRARKAQPVALGEGEG